MTLLATMDMVARDLTKPVPSVNALSTEATAMTTRRREIEEIYRKYGGMVSRRCLQILKNETEAADAAQDVFVRVLKSIRRFRGQSSPATWLYRISTNICLNRVRDKSNRERLRNESLAPLEATQPIELWSRDLVLQVLSGFDKTTREVIVYSVIEGMTYEEVAQIMNCSVAKVRKCMAKFKANAKKKANRLLREYK